MWLEESAYIDRLRRTNIIPFLTCHFTQMLRNKTILTCIKRSETEKAESNNIKSMLFLLPCTDALKYRYLYKLYQNELTVNISSIR